MSLLQPGLSQPRFPGPVRWRLNAPGAGVAGPRGEAEPGLGSRAASQAQWGASEPLLLGFFGGPTSQGGEESTGHWRLTRPPARLPAGRSGWVGCSSPPLPQPAPPLGPFQKPPQRCCFSPCGSCRLGSPAGVGVSAPGLRTVLTSQLCSPMQPAPSAPAAGADPPNPAPSPHRAWHPWAVGPGAPCSGAVEVSAE